MSRPVVSNAAPKVKRIRTETFSSPELSLTSVCCDLEDAVFLEKPGGRPVNKHTSEVGTGLITIGFNHVLYREGDEELCGRAG